MKKIEATTLEDALIIATKEFNCSVIDLEYEIIQNPTKGFLGFGKKDAIICAQLKINSAKDMSKVASKAPENFHNTFVQNSQTHTYLVDSVDSDGCEREEFDKKAKKYQVYSKEELAQIAKDVEKELQELLDLLPYKLDKVFVEPCDENTLYVKIDGEDSALLIGKEGYRYKAISYLVFNWVNHIYGLMIRLEVAEFLRNQEEMIAHHLLPTIESIKTTGKAQTKPLDGVLAHIALKQLREKFPDKYVSFRINSGGERYIIVNDFYH